MARRKLLVGALAATLLGGLVYLNTPPALVSAAPTPDLPDDIDGYVAAAERQVTAQYSLVPDTEKRLTWYAEPGARTAYAVVNLHGFSATRQETAPLAERIAAYRRGRERAGLSPDGGERPGWWLALVQSVGARRGDTLGDEKEDFEMLGLRGDIEMHLDPVFFEGRILFVEDDETFEALFEAMLNADLVDDRWQRFESLNMGVPGYRPLQQLPTLERALEFQPDAFYYIATGRELSRGAYYLAQYVTEGGVPPYPELQRIADAAGLAEATDLSDGLRRLREASGAQMAILIVRTTGGEPAIRCACRSVSARMCAATSTTIQRSRRLPPW